MEEISIIIPSRLGSTRLPDKPLKKIKNLEMILHVNDIALKSNIGKVYVATPDEKIIKIVRDHGGEAVKTNFNHKTGTDRIFEVFKDFLKEKSKIIINLQGDMPNLDPVNLKILAQHMKKNLCDIGTLASKLESENDNTNQNIVKVQTKDLITNNKFSEAEDFYRIDKSKKEKIYHHIGIYAFTANSLSKFVNFKRTDLEINRKLEQMRAMENNMKIHVGYTESCPLSVDTEEDLSKVKKIMEKYEK